MKLIVKFEEGRTGVPVAFSTEGVLLPLLEQGSSQPLTGEVWEVTTVRPFYSGRGYFVRCYKQWTEADLEDSLLQQRADALLKEAENAGRPAWRVEKIAKVPVEGEGRELRVGSHLLGRTIREAARNALPFRDMVEKGWKVRVNPSK